MVGGGIPVYFMKAQVSTVNGIYYNSLISKQPIPRISPNSVSPKPVPVPVEI